MGGEITGFGEKKVTTNDLNEILMMSNIWNWFSIFVGSYHPNFIYKTATAPELWLFKFNSTQQMQTLNSQSTDG